MDHSNLTFLSLKRLTALIGGIATLGAALIFCPVQAAPAVNVTLKSALGDPNIAPSGTGYVWATMASSTANNGRTAKPGVNNNNLSINNNVSSGDIVGGWEAAGVVFSSAKNVSSVKFYNGDLTSGGDGYFEASIKLQFTTDGTTWADSGWTISPAYSYTASAAGKVYTFSGAAINGVRGARVAGQVRVKDGSYFLRVKEVQVFGSTGGSENTYAITASAGANGAISPISATVKQGANQTFTFTPSPGYAVNGVTVDGTNVGAVSSYTFSNVQAAHSLSVTFAAASCTTVPSVPTGLASPSQTSNSVNLSWNAATTPANCSVTYDVYQNGKRVLTVPTTTAVMSGLGASTSYSFTVDAVNPAGTSAQSASIEVKTQAEQGGPAANFDPATLAMLTEKTGLNAEQWNNIMKLINKPEQDNLDWVKYYGYCENINDGRGYTIGIFGATTGGSNDTGPDGPALFKEYDKVCGASNPSIAGGLARIGIQGAMSGSILKITESKTAFTNHIKGMQNVANWRTAMWNTFYNVYIGYCVEQMKARGFTTALTLGSFVDCALNQGASGDSGALSGMLSQTGNISDEAAFMTQFYKVRTKVVDTNEYNQPPNGANRVKEWSTLLSKGETDLINCDAQIVSVCNWVMQ